MKHISFFYPVLLYFDMLTRNNSFNPYIHNVGILLGMIFAMNIVFIWKDAKSSFACIKGMKFFSQSIESSCFFIFAFHFIILIDLLRIVLFIMNRWYNPYVMIICYITIPLITVLVLVKLYFYIKRNKPSLLILLTGGR